MAQNLPNPEAAPATMGLVPDDLLAKLIADAENTALHETVPVPGVVMFYCIGPALRELQDRRRADRGRPALRPVPGPTRRPKDAGGA